MLYELKHRINNFLSRENAEALILVNLKEGVGRIVIDSLAESMRNYSVDRLFILFGS